MLGRIGSLRIGINPYVAAIASPLVSAPMNTSIAQPIRLTERQRSVLEMRAAGYYWSQVIDALELDVGWTQQWVEIEDLLGAKSPEHAVALAIRGGHIL